MSPLPFQTNTTGAAGEECDTALQVSNDVEGFEDEIGNPLAGAENFFRKHKAVARRLWPVETSGNRIRPLDGWFLLQPEETLKYTKLLTN